MNQKKKITGMLPLALYNTAPIETNRTIYLSYFLLTGNV